MTNVVLFQKFKHNLTLEKSIDIIHWMKDKKSIWLAKKFIGVLIRCYGKTEWTFFPTQQLFSWMQRKMKKLNIQYYDKNSQQILQ